MNELLLATSYPPPISFFSGLASAYCELAAAALALLSLGFCWFRSTARFAYGSAKIALGAASLGLVLLLVLEVGTYLDRPDHYKMGGEALKEIGMYWGIPALLAVVAWVVNRQRQRRGHEFKAG